jgi:hypothetical protein
VKGGYPSLLSETLISFATKSGVRRQQANELPIFAICLLTKDDLPILPEWISYHYEALQLRHLIVAVDPGSQSNPKDLFQKFNTHLHGLQIDQWSDGDFMPDFFLNGSYGMAPNFVGGVELHDKQTWQEWYSGRKRMGPFRIKDQTQVNNHRYRQTRFLAQCSNYLAKTYTKNDVYMSTLDSDEYLVINPSMISSQQYNDRWTKGSVLQWLVDFKRQKTTLHQVTSFNISSPCIQVPRLLFGSVERNTTDDMTIGLVRRGSNEISLQSIQRSHSPMETLRWKYHAAWDDTRNFQQKVILDLHRIPKDDELWSDHVNSVHRPSRRFCDPETPDNNQGTLIVGDSASPVSAFHYIGSVERYFSRPNDVRRNMKRYRERSNLTFGQESGWIDQWLSEFVNHVGIGTASILLEDYIVDEIF